MLEVDLPILVLVLFVDAAHESSGGREDLIDEDEDGLLRRKLNSLANNVDELAYGEICGYEVLLLIDRSDIALLDLLANDLLKHGMSASCGRSVGDGSGRRGNAGW
jgi:hypothetical protein